MTTFKLAGNVQGIDIEMFDTEVLSVYLLLDDEPTLIDAGTAKGETDLRRGLLDLGLSVESVENVILSHIHVDHSGGAGALAADNPDTNVYIHESMLSHAADPTRLIESSKQALGESFQSMGEQSRVPKRNLRSIPAEGTTINTGSRRLEVIPVTGHSPDHLAIWDSQNRILFANETLGYYFPRTDTWLPPATIPNFDVEAVEEAIGMLRELDPACIALAHFGEWSEAPSRAFDIAIERLQFFDEQILALADQHDDVDELERVVEAELLDLTPEYDPRVERFYAHLLTSGYLLNHERL